MLFLGVASEAALRAATPCCRGGHLRQGGPSVLCCNCIFSFPCVCSLSRLHSGLFFLSSYKQATLKLHSDKALWILKVTFFSRMNTSFPLIHLLFLQTQSITDDINYVNIQRFLSMSSSFSNMLIFKIHLKCRKDGEELSGNAMEERK